jgi:hypothetical protein
MSGAFSQLASVSAFLGGFAFAFLGALLSSESRSKARAITAGLVVPSAACFVLCALGWSLISVWIAGPRFQPQEPLPLALQRTHLFLSPIFLSGILFFLFSLGACGWVYSRRLGWVSTSIAVLAAIFFVRIVWPFLILL